MPIFKYKAIKQGGESYEGTMEAPDRFTVYRKVKSEEGTVTQISETKEKVRFRLPFISLAKKVKTQDKIIFARNLGAMLEAGLSVTRSIAVMEKQAKNKKLKAVLNELDNGISKGNTLSDSMKNFPDVFSPLFVSMVKAGEESGNLAGSLKIVAMQTEKAYALVKKVRGAMIYPGIILSVMGVIGILMLVYMVPTLTVTFTGLNIKLPLSTRAVIAVSEFIRAHYILLPLSALIIVALAVLFFKSPRGRHLFDSVILKIPVIGFIVKEVNSARTARTLSSLLTSGVDVVVALGVTRDILQNNLYKDVIEKAQQNIQKGEPISSVFSANEKLYPVFVSEMMSVGEETGKMADMLLGVAVFYEDEVDQRTKDMSTIIEPILMVIIGIGVGIFAISMLAPTYSLVNAI